MINLHDICIVIEVFTTTEIEGYDDIIHTINPHPNISNTVLPALFVMHLGGT